MTARRGHCYQAAQIVLAVLALLCLLAVSAERAGAADGENIVGEWQSEYGSLTFVHDGEARFTGNYKSRGSATLRGTLKGRVFSGYWSAPSAPKACDLKRDDTLYWGRIQLSFDSAFSRFSGFWTYCEETRHSGDWRGRRQGTADETQATGLPPAVQALFDQPDAVATAHCKGSDLFALVVHGGAVYGQGGDHSLKSAFLKRLLERNRARLDAGASALDIVQASIRLMEDSGLFNAGRGAIANEAGEVELDASIMEGRLRRAGAVAAVRNTKNPISAARLVMEKSKHLLFVGPAADAFVERQGGARVEQSYFRLAGDSASDVPLPDDLSIEPPAKDLPPSIAALSGIWVGRWSGSLNTILAVEKVTATSAEVILAEGAMPEWGMLFPNWIRTPAEIDEATLRLRFRNGDKEDFAFSLTDDGHLKAVYNNRTTGLRNETLLKRRGKRAETEDHGTVGAVALDRCGDLAAGTSTGGFSSKTPGRVGDSPIIGAGTYADNATAAVSATGHGEFFIRYAVAYDVTARMRYKGETLQQAARRLIKYDLPKTGLTGGIIAVDRQGNVATPFNTSGMVRGAVGSDIPLSVEIY